MGVHGHPGHPLIDAAAPGPADVQRWDLSVGHLGPVGGVDPGVGAGRLLGLLMLSGLRVAVSVVFVKGFADGFHLPGGEEILGVILFEAQLVGTVSVPQQLLQRRALLLAVVKLRSGLRNLLVDVLVVHAHELRLRHGRFKFPRTVAPESLPHRAACAHRYAGAQVSLRWKQGAGLTFV